MIRFAGIALLALTGGCTLSSKTALIPPGFAPAELKLGRYRIYLPLEEADAMKLGDARTKACLKTVRSVEGSDTPNGPRRIERIVYCDRDPNTRDGPYDVELSGAPGRYSLKGPEGVSTLAFRPLGDGRYLAQTQKAPTTTGYQYVAVGLHGDEAEVFTLGCEEFPSVRKASETVCEIASLKKISGELAKVIQRIEAETKVPITILKRIP
ncbi:MAG: hypothetical protein V4808_05880 [Pseudomonadota bacterium]